jgi:DNA-binding MarR family transcriptional regulator
MKTEFEISKGHQLLALLGTTLNALLKARRKELETSGITIAQTWVLWGLKVRGEPLTVAEISQFIDRSHLTTSQLLKRMEKDGLIVRKKGPQSNGPVKIMTTKKGKEILHYANKRHKLLDEITASLSPNEVQNLSSYLKKLRESAIGKAAVHSSFHSTSTYGLGT